VIYETQLKRPCLPSLFCCISKSYDTFSYKKRIQSSVKRLLYDIITRLSDILGSWIFRIFVWFVATGYFLFFPARVRTGSYFYKALYPDRGKLFNLWCVWKQYHSFAKVFVERFEYSAFNNIDYISHGEEHLQHALLNNRGGVILMSHLGNWEIAAHILKQKYKDLPLLLYMGVKNKEQIESMQKSSLKESGIQIIGVGEGEESPYEIIQGVRFLRSGGFVSMTGDVLWHSGQRSVEARFLNHSVQLAEIPHYLALISGSPLFVLFSFRVEQGKYIFSVSDPIYLSGESALEKKQAVQHSVQTYATLLEQYAREYPFQWYHFKPFLGQRLN